MKRCLALVAAAAAAVVAAGGVCAQTGGLPFGEGTGPIVIEADGAIELHRRARIFVARGNARAHQGEVRLRADAITASYRDTESGGKEVWRIEAAGAVEITAPDRRASAGRGVYELDTKLLVLTGAPRIETGRDRIAADEALEFWHDRNLAVARGNAVAVRGDRRLQAGVLTAVFETDASGESQVRRIDATDEVMLSTAEETVRADRGAYDLKTGIVTLEGSVTIVRGNDRLSGGSARVDLNTGVSRLSGGPGGARGVFAPGPDRPAADRVGRTPGAAR